jgi:hypothetical protein
MFSFIFLLPITVDLLSFSGLTELRLDRTEGLATSFSLALAFQGTSL